MGGRLRFPNPLHAAWPAFFLELRRLGYVEGENLIIEHADLVREIVTRNPDVIVTGTNPVVTAFKAATSTIPVVPATRM
jgi:putative ABC transport system substrate-binding protein